jgi:hypothetical protein
LQLGRDFVGFRLGPELILRALGREDKGGELHLICGCRPGVCAEFVAAGDLQFVVEAASCGAVKPQDERIFLLRVVVERHEQAIGHLVALLVGVGVLAEEEIVCAQYFRRSLSKAASACAYREQYS